MNRKILPESQRYLAWTMAIAAFFMILLTGYIAVQATAIDSETEQMVTAIRQPPHRAR